MIDNFLRSCQGADRRILDQRILEGIPRIGPLIRRTCEVIADAVRVRVIESRKIHEKIFTFVFETGRWMKLKVKKRGPENIRDGHQFEVVGGVIPKLRTGLNVRTQPGIPFSLYLCRALVLQVLHCARGKFFPGSSASRPGKFLFEQGKQSLHPAGHGFLHRQQSGHGPLQQPVSEVDITLRQHIARGLTCQQSNAKALGAVALDVRKAGAAINEKSWKIFDRHPAHIAHIEVHQGLDANRLVQKINGGKIVAVGTERVSRRLFQQHASPASRLAFHQGGR